ESTRVAPAGVRGSQIHAGSCNMPTPLDSKLPRAGSARHRMRARPRLRSHSTRHPSSTRDPAPPISATLLFGPHRPHHERWQSERKSRKSSAPRAVMSEGDGNTERPDHGPMDQFSAHLDRGWDLIHRGDLAGAQRSAEKSLELD